MDANGAPFIVVSWYNYFSSKFNEIFCENGYFDMSTQEIRYWNIILIEQKLLDSLNLKILVFPRQSGITFCGQHKKGLFYHYTRWFANDHSLKIIKNKYQTDKIPDARKMTRSTRKSSMQMIMKKKMPWRKSFWILSKNMIRSQWKLMKDSNMSNE